MNKDILPIIFFAAISIAILYFQCNMNNLFKDCGNAVINGKYPDEVEACMQLNQIHQFQKEVGKFFGR